MRSKEKEKKEERENKTIAGISTAVIMSLLFLLMLFLVFGSTPIEDDLDGGGVAVSLGEPDAGGPSEEASAPQQKKATAQEQVDDPVLSQDDDNAPVVKKTNKPKPKTESKPKVDSDLSNILNGLGKNKTKGKGKGKKTGNEGEKDGSDGDGKGDGVNGTGDHGFGVSHTLGSRRITRNPPSNNNFTRSGTVVLKIFVDRSGKVIRASVYRGSSNDPNLQRIAKELAYQTRFDSNLNGPAEQEGKITFKFEL